VAAYDRNLSDVAINNVILIGYSEKFDEMNFRLASPASGCSVQWSYRNGMSYVSLTLTSDGTSGLTNISLIQQAKLTNNYDGVLFDSGGDGPAFVQQANLDVRQDQTWSQLENTLYDFERTTLHNRGSTPI
jgi:hypothetical protein